MPKIGKTVRQPKSVSGQGYCRMCSKMISLSNFYEATNPFLDKSGFMSICKDHCNEIYQKYFEIYGNMEKALYFTCRDLDVCFNDEAFRQTQSHIEKLLHKGKSADKVFGYYKSKLGSTGKNNDKIDYFRFIENDNNSRNIFENNMEINSEIDEDLLLFWGGGFDLDDYFFLENELSNWKQTHKCDNRAELILLKEICIKILIIRNKRKVGQSVSADIKELQELMKTASYDPAKANVASAGKSIDAYSIWIKDIEQFTPAEWHNKQDKYKDMDGFVPYIKNYIVRPIKNFITGSRDFKVKDNINVDISENEGDLSG